MAASRWLCNVKRRKSRISPQPFDSTQGEHFYGIQEGDGGLCSSPAHNVAAAVRRNKLPGNWNVAGLKLKVVVIKRRVQRKASSAEGGAQQFISCRSTYCLLGRHSWCNTQLAQLHFITPTVSSGSDFPDSPIPMSYQPRCDCKFARRRGGDTITRLFLMGSYRSFHFSVQVVQVSRLVCFHTFTEESNHSWIHGSCGWYCMNYRYKFCRSFDRATVLEAITV